MTSDFEYDDTPYREDPARRPYTGLFVSFGLDGEPFSDVWVYVDGADTRVARQRFTYAEFNVDGTYERWLGQLVLRMHEDPEGREQCGDCGNFRAQDPTDRGYHAPDCAHYDRRNSTT